MQSTPQDASFEARLNEFIQYLDELDRRSRSSFAVTNSTTGVKNLEVDGNGVRLRDDAGNIIFGPGSGWGIAGPRYPMPAYPSQPASALLFGTDTTWVTCWQTRTIINTAGVAVNYRCRDALSSGGTAEFRVAYDAGSGLVVMPGSAFSGVNLSPSTEHPFTYTWPEGFSIYDTEISIFFQCRMASGSGNAVISPIYLLGS